MEEAIAQYYAARVSFPEALREEIRAMTADAMRENHGLSDEVRDQYTRRLETLDKKESYLLDLAAEEGRPKERLRDKIREIRVERSNIEQCMTDTEQEQFASGRHLLDQALDLLDRPAERYVDGNETVRTLMNRAIFARFVVDGTKVINGELKEPFDALIGAAERDEVRVYLRQVGSLPGRSGGTRGGRGRGKLPQIATCPTLADEDGARTDDLSLTDLLELAWLQRARGSNKTVMVELRGFEPLTPSMRTRCATGLRYSPRRSPTAGGTGDKVSRSAKPAANQIRDPTHPAPAMACGPPHDPTAGPAGCTRLSR